MSLQQGLDAFEQFAVTSAGTLQERMPLFCWHLEGLREENDVPLGCIVHGFMAILFPPAVESNRRGGSQSS